MVRALWELPYKGLEGKVPIYEAVNKEFSSQLRSKLLKS
jgi:hypothetical protein